MNINKINGKSLHFLNRDNVVVKRGWYEDLVVSGNAHYGVGDSLGRNAYALFCYDEDDTELLIEGLKSFFTYQRTSPETGWHWYVKRYPRGEGYAVRGNSRDHTLKAIFALHMLGQNDFVNDFIKSKAKRPCIDHPYGIDKQIWFKTLHSNIWSWIYAIIYMIKAIFRRLSMWLFRLLTLRHIRSSKDIESFIINRPVPKNKWAKFVSKKQLIHPVYAQLYGAVIRHGMKSESAKRFTFFFDRSFGFSLFDKSNYVLRALYGHKITKKEFENNKYCTKNRWSCRLDFTNDRDIDYADKDDSGNVYHALFTAIYDNQQKYGRFHPFGMKVSK